MFVPVYGVVLNGVLWFCFVASPNYSITGFAFYVQEGKRDYLGFERDSFVSQIIMNCFKTL